MAVNDERLRTTFRVAADDDDFDGRRRDGGLLAHTGRRWILAVVLLAIVVAAVALTLHHSHKPSRAAVPAPTHLVPTPLPTLSPSTVAGVLVGYPDTQDGAEAAAANYAVAYGSQNMFRTQQRHAIVAAIADPSVLTTLQAQLDQTFGTVLSRFGLDAAGNPPPGEVFVDRTLPVGVHVVTYTAGHAQIAVWTAGIVGLAGQGSTLPVAEAWNTATVTLHWTDGDWKWVAVTQTDGPTPVSGLQTPSSAADIAQAVASFEGLPYAR